MGIIKNLLNSAMSLNEQIENINKIKSSSNMGHGYNIYSGGGKYINALNTPTKMKYNRAVLVARSKEEKYKSTVYASMLYWLTTYTVGTGYRLNVKPVWDILNIDNIQKRQEIRKNIENKIKLIFDSDSLSSVATLPTWKFISDVFYNYILTGDVFILFHYHTDENSLSPIKLQFIPTENIATPPDKTYDKNIIDGVRVDERGSPVSYFVITNRNNDSSSITNNYEMPKYEEIKIYTEHKQLQMLHIANKNEINDIRGIPPSTNIFHELENINSAIVSELDAQKINASTLGFIERQLGALTSDGLTRASLYRRDLDIDKSNPPTLDIFDSPGVIFNNLNPGETFKSLATDRPNLNIPQFISEILKPITSSQGIPMEILYGLFSNNYSASRAAIQQFWKSIQVYRNNFINSFCKPVYESIITELIYMGELELEGYTDDKYKCRAWLNHDWVGSTQPSLDPNKDVEAATKAILQGLTTRGSVAMELFGKDYDENIEILKEEEEKYKSVYSMGGINRNGI